MEEDNRSIKSELGNVRLPQNRCVCYTGEDGPRLLMHTIRVMEIIVVPMHEHIPASCFDCGIAFCTNASTLSQGDEPYCQCCIDAV